MKSIRNVSLIFEAFSLAFFLILFILAAILLQRQLNEQVLNELNATMETVEHSIDIYLSERSGEFEMITNSVNPVEIGRLFAQFADIYYVNAQNEIVEIIKRGSNSRIFVGYGISDGDFSKFLNQSMDDAVAVSSVLRSVESDTVSIYMASGPKTHRMIARIEMEMVNQYIKKIAESFESVIIIASNQGYILTSSLSQLPFKIVPDENAIEVSLQESYFLTKFESSLLNNTIVLMTPTSRFDGTRSIMLLFTLVLGVLIVISFVLKVIIQDKVILLPLREFMTKIKEYDLKDTTFKTEDSILKTQEVQALYKAFNEKTQEIETSFMRIDQDRQQAMKQLIESEKLTSLGGLVAGIAHEVNTPIGVCVTASSYMRLQNNKINALLANGKLSKNAFESYLSEEAESLDILTVSLDRASELIKSFKQLAVEQTSEFEVRFDLEEQIHVVLAILKHEYKRSNHQFLINIDKPIWINSQPGWFHQIFTNLIMNSLIHGFETTDQGIIWIEARVIDEFLFISYRDNGKGIPIDIERKVFEPFFTTKRHTGGSGLGLHIIFTIVTQRLGGQVEIDRKCTEGLKFDIRIPVVMDAEGICHTIKKNIPFES